jgi:hypothetical protein
MHVPLYQPDPPYYLLPTTYYPGVCQWVRTRGHTHGIPCEMDIVSPLQSSGPVSYCLTPCLSVGPREASQTDRQLELKIFTLLGGARPSPPSVLQENSTGPCKLVGLQNYA